MRALAKPSTRVQKRQLFPKARHSSNTPACMEDESCHSNRSVGSAFLPSDQSECNSDDSAFAKTPIRPESDAEDGDDTSSCDTTSSNASPHMNNQGDRTYFHVWGDMLTCGEMSTIAQKAEEEEPKYVIDDDETQVDSDVHKPLSIDASMPCPLIQFGPVPKRRSKPQQQQQQQPKDSGTEVPVPRPASTGATAPGPSAGEGHSDCRDERCCDFSVVAAKNKARLKKEEKLRRLERKKLVRY